MPTANGATHELVYLLASEQEVSAVEDPALADVALGGPDTMQRRRILQHFVRQPSQSDTCDGAWRELESSLAAPGCSWTRHSMRVESAPRCRFRSRTPRCHRPVPARGYRRLPRRREPDDPGDGHGRRGQACSRLSSGDSTTLPSSTGSRRRRRLGLRHYDAHPRQRARGQLPLAPRPARRWSCCATRSSSPRADYIASPCRVRLGAHRGLRSGPDAARDVRASR